MGPEAVLNSLADAFTYLLTPTATILSQLETAAISLFRQRTATAFRMFPPREEAFVSLMPGTNVRDLHAMYAALVLFFVTYLVWHDRNRRAGYVATWTRPLWRNSLLWALFLGFVRLWIIAAFWNKACLKIMEETVQLGAINVPSFLVWGQMHNLVGPLFFLL
jgi:hypothetical protein